MVQGQYSCEITKTFGTSCCRSTFVEVFRNTEFSNKPQESVGYLNSPKRTYLTCAIKNVSDGGNFTLFFRPFSASTEEKEHFRMLGPFIEVNKEKTLYQDTIHVFIAMNQLVQGVERLLFVF